MAAVNQYFQTLLVCRGKTVAVTSLSVSHHVYLCYRHPAPSPLLLSIHSLFYVFPAQGGYVGQQYGPNGQFPPQQSQYPTSNTSRPLPSPNYPGQRMPGQQSQGQYPPGMPMGQYYKVCSTICFLLLSAIPCLLEKNMTCALGVETI